MKNKTQEELEGLRGRCSVDESVKKLDRSSLHHKFIIANVAERLVYFADTECDSNGIERPHAKIARAHNLEDSAILGGGHVLTSATSRYHQHLSQERPAYPIFTSRSTAYGSIPNEVMELFRDELLSCEAYNWSKNNKRIMVDMR